MGACRAREGHPGTTEGVRGREGPVGQAVARLSGFHPWFLGGNPTTFQKCPVLCPHFSSLATPVSQDFKLPCEGGEAIGKGWGAQGATSHPHALLPV